jgi:hypothetical protein
MTSLSLGLVNILRFHHSFRVDIVNVYCANPENTTQKTKDQATQIPTKTEVNSGASEGLGILAVHAPFVTPVVLLLSIVLHTNIHI